MSLEVKQFENQLMRPNCYILVDWSSKSCVVIDPASEKSEREIDYIEQHSLILDYITLTHEHTDHTWGVNALKHRYPNAKILCSEACNKYAKKASRVYFLYYYDDPNYRYIIEPADVVMKENEDYMYWRSHQFSFVITPGHSFGSMCIGIDGMLFTGDTIMPYKPYFNGRDSNEDDWRKSVELINKRYIKDTVIFPGHGDTLTLGEWIERFYNK